MKPKKPTRRILSRRLVAKLPGVDIYMEKVEIGGKRHQRFEWFVPVFTNAGQEKWEVADGKQEEASQ